VDGRLYRFHLLNAEDLRDRSFSSNNMLSSHSSPFFPAVASILNTVCSSAPGMALASRDSAVVHRRPPGQRGGNQATLIPPEPIILFMRMRRPSKAVVQSTISLFGLHVPSQLMKPRVFISSEEHLWFHKLIYSSSFPHSNAPWNHSFYSKGTNSKCVVVKHRIY